MSSFSGTSPNFISLFAQARARGAASFRSRINVHNASNSLLGSMMGSVRARSKFCTAKTRSHTPPEAEGWLDLYRSNSCAAGRLPTAPKRSAASICCFQPADVLKSEGMNLRGNVCVETGCPTLARSLNSNAVKLIGSGIGRLRTSASSGSRSAAKRADVVGEKAPKVFKVK